MVAPNHGLIKELTPSRQSSVGVVPIAAVIPTRNRPLVLVRALNSLRAQGTLPAEIIVIDASSDDVTKAEVMTFGAEVIAGGCWVRWYAASAVGAAAQRNQGIALATQPVIAFFDDDVLFEPECLQLLWSALQSDGRFGGVNAMITNQRYHAPGLVSRTVFRILAGEAAPSYAGRVLGPAVHLLPEDRDDLPEIVATEWLNTTCTLYRREALPDPSFPDFFTGYSMMEDVALSVRVARNWKLANVRTARIFHDSQPGEHKDNVVSLSRMELVNRHYVMTEVLGRRRVPDYARLALWESFQLSVCAVQQRGGPAFWRMARGKLLALGDIIGAQRRPDAR
jgi:glycosyltransferase involved in cell wall biosynthesis